MNPQKKFHLIFSILMGTMMVFLMTFVITLVNVGWVDNFFQLWARVFGIAYVIAVPVIYFLAPVARKLTGRLLNMPN
jgi:predicted membrane channel-forming protein YqfA (hemolysin III family)